MLREYILPVRYGSVGVQLTRLRALCQGNSYFRMCLEKSERDCFTSYLYSEAILASFVFIHVVKGVLSSEFVD